MARIVLLGYGQLASQLPSLLPKHQFTGVRRTPVMTADDQIEMISLDLGGPAKQIKQTLQALGMIDAVVYTATPGARTEDEYRHTYCEVPEKLIKIFKELQRQPHWVHVSSTGVFHHNAGEWVHENTEPAPQTPIARILRASELIVEHQHKNASILRFGGLYGQGRTHLLHSLKAGRRLQQAPWTYTNRIHRTDAARAIAFLLERALAKKPAGAEYFHGVDHDPAPLHQVARHLVKLHQLQSPEYFTLEGRDAIASQNKRVGNRRLIELGFQFLYPSYRVGL